MSPAFLASLTLGALVAWLAWWKRVTSKRFRQMAKDARKLSNHRL